MMNKCKLQRWLAGLAAVLGLAAEPAAWANDDAPGRVGRVAEVQGQAWLSDPDSGEWVALQRNRPVTQGDRLTVDGGARLELRIGSSTLRVAADTDLQFDRLDDDAIAVHLHRGSVALRAVADDVAHEWSVSTQHGRFLPQRSGHWRVDAAADTSFATAYSGELRFQASDSALAVAPGQRAEFWAEGGRTHYTWADTPRDAFGDWVARDSRQDERGPATRYVSPEMTGWEDLDRHGRWDTHPEYGPVWSPTVVVAGWAPYRHGQWAWVRPWGWTWVDDAPWGFAPSHYGRWVHWGGRWCWAPGQRVLRPVYSPALVAWVGGPHLSVGIRVGGAPAVGWVPLAPRELYRPGYRVRPDHWRHVNPWHRYEAPRPPGQVPTGPIMYTNQGVPGGISVAPGAALQSRQPIRPVALEPEQQRRWAHERWQPQAPAVPAVQGVPAVPRVVPVPGGAVPAPAQRHQPPPAEPRPPQRHQPPPAAPVVVAPAVVAPAVVPPVVRHQPPAAERQGPTERHQPMPRAQPPAATPPQREPSHERPRERERERDTAPVRPQRSSVQ